MTFNFLGPGLTVNVEAKVQEQIILDSSGYFCLSNPLKLQRKSDEGLASRIDDL